MGHFASNGGCLHSQPGNPPDGREAAFSADCGIPLCHRPGLRNDADRWGALFNRLIEPHIHDVQDPTAAAVLLAAGYSPATRTSYTSKFRPFMTYCEAQDRTQLPASTATMVGYILWQQQRGKLAPASLEKYLSAIKTVHMLAGLCDPLQHYLVRLARHGYRRSRGGAEYGETESPDPPHTNTPQYSEV